jgi:hypothetical protein
VKQKEEKRDTNRVKQVEAVRKRVRQDEER